MGKTMFKNLLKSTATRFGDSMQNFANGIQLTDGKSSGVTYVESNISNQEMSAAYSSSWIAAKVIDKPIEDAFRAWREWVAGDPKQVTAIEITEERLKYKERVKEARVLADVVGQSYLYMDVQGAGKIEEPLEITETSKINIRFLTVLSSDVVVEGQLEEDPLSENYGLPTYYEINGSTQHLKIHPSRIAVFYGRKRTNTGITFQKRADGVLKVGMEALKQYEATAKNVTDLTFEAKIDIMSVKGLSKQVATVKGAEAVTTHYETLKQIKTSNGMIVLDGDSEEYEQKQVNFSNLPEVVKTAAMAVAGAFSIPHTILFGESEGGLGSSGNLELSTYYDRIENYQNNKISEPLLIFDRLLVIEATGSDDPKIIYTWRPLWQISSKDKAEIGKTQSETLAKLLDIYPEDVVAKIGLNILSESGIAAGIEDIFAEWEIENPNGEIEEENKESGNE